MKPILFRRCKLKKDDSYGVGGNKIGATLVAHETHGIICWNFDRRVDGQMSMFLAAMCKAIENLHGDISYVLIGGQRWQIRWWQWFWRRGGASGGGDSTLRTSDCGRAVGRWHWKGLLTTEDEAAENIDKTRLQDIRKLEQWLWYHVWKTERLYCISLVIEYTWMPLYRRQSMQYK